MPWHSRQKRPPTAARCSRKGERFPRLRKAGAEGVERDKKRTEDEHMFDVRIWPLTAAKRLYRYIFADKRTRKMLRYVPETCLMCELLGICRDEHDKWRCRKGCL